MTNKVYILSTTTIFGGGEIFQIKLAALLRGQFCFVVISPPLPALKSGLAEFDAGFVELKTSGWRMPQSAFLLWLWKQRAALRLSKTLIVLNGRGAAYLAPFVRLLIGTSPVIIYHTALSMTFGDVKEFLYGVAARFARRVVAVSDATAEQHRERWPGLPVQAIPNWIDESSVPAVAAPFLEPIRCAVVARLAPGKGVEDVVRACANVPWIELHVYGDGPMRDQFRDMSREFSWLHLHGYVDDLSLRLPSHPIMISASYSEAYSYSIAEGIQAGMLCVLTDIPAHREMLGPAYPEDLFFPPGDLSALKHALQAARAAFLKNDGLKAKSAIFNARARIAQRHDPEVARQRYIAVLSATNNEHGGSQ